jgi:hypothetical protein
MNGLMDVEKNEYPWIVSIKADISEEFPGFNCIGTIINSNFILIPRVCIQYDEFPKYAILN